MPLNEETKAPSKVHTCGLGVRDELGGPLNGTPLQRVSHIDETLPKMLRGSIHAQWVKCGKPGCRCARGRLHGPYFYLFRRVDGRLRKTYVSRQVLPQAVAAVQAYRNQRRRLRGAWSLFRESRDTVRTVEANMGREEGDGDG